MSWKHGVWSEEKGWEGPSLLKMAAVYDAWTDGSVSIIFEVR